MGIYFRILYKTTGITKVRQSLGDFLMAFKTKFTMGMLYQ